MALGLLLALGSPPDAAAQQTSERTGINVVVFIVDDLGWQDVSVPLAEESTPFNRRYRTPHALRLAREGVRFTQAYASAPVCTPTRVSLMTGRSPGQTGITFWILHGDRDTSRAHPLVRPPQWNTRGLQPEDVTLPRLLAEAGYRTIHVGKAHLGARGTPGADPLALGFERNVAGHAAGAPGSYYGLEDFAASRRGRGRASRGETRKPSVWDVPGLEAYHGKDVYLTEALAERAEAELREAARDGRPFFLHFAPYAVHTPLMANPRYAANYAHLSPRERAYATMVESADAALGRVLDVLDELELAERTLVVFTSDNGGLSALGRGGRAHEHNAPLRSGKGSAYEGGVRVPQLARWPAVLPAGGVVTAPVVTHDLFTTILAATGVAVPDDYAESVEGIDWLPLADGRVTAPPYRSLFWHQPHQWGARGPGIFPFTSVRSGDLKLIFRHADREFELYDLSRDLGELCNLAHRSPTIVRILAKELDRWCEDRGVSMSIDLTTDRPIGLPGTFATD